MARTNTEGYALIKLSDSDFTLEDPSHDIRGRDLYDVDGDQIGTVEDLYVDEQEGEVRFLTFSSGGFWGTSIGETYRMIPVEAITDASGERVTIDFNRPKVESAPEFDINVAPTADYQRGIYDYYGYEYPAAGEATDEDEVRVRRTEEELRAGTRERQVGVIRVRKQVRTDHERVEVPKRREEVTVDRVPVEGEATETEIGEEEVSVPVTEEEVVVEKRPVAKEEVRIRKDVVEDTETVEEEVRREEVEVDDQSTGRTR